MKIYFSGSIRGGRYDAAIYHELVEYLKQFGHVLTAFIGSIDLPETDEEGVEDSDIWKRDVEWVEEADVLIAETTQASLGVGYEIAIANKAGTPVLALFRESRGKRLSGMIGGDPNVTVNNYQQIDEAYSFIDTFLKWHTNNSK